MEIERKFLIGEPPAVGRFERSEIEQGYLALADDRGRAEVRLRRRGELLTLTVKGGSGEVRVEEELEIDRERFESLWPLTEGRRLTKSRHLIAHGPLTIELDVYGGELEGLVTAEVEFGDKAEADGFEPPAWFGREVTGERPYTNARLAAEGPPPP